MVVPLPGLGCQRQGVLAVDVDDRVDVVVDLVIRERTVVMYSTGDRDLSRNIATTSTAGRRCTGT